MFHLQWSLHPVTLVPDIAKVILVMMNGKCSPENYRDTKISSSFMRLELRKKVLNSNVFIYSTGQTLFIDELGVPLLVIQICLFVLLLWLGSFYFLYLNTHVFKCGNVLLGQDEGKTDEGGLCVMKKALLVCIGELRSVLCCRLCLSMPRILLLHICS